MSSPMSPADTSTGRSISIGSAAEQVLCIGYRARRPVLLEGAPGIGKSELIRQVADQLGIQCIVVDLSLCEPSDLTGLPRLDGDRTVFLPPDFLPRDGKGLLVFEELNRADRYVQGPVLQLLSARRLNSYELPEGWSCVAAINPDDGKNDVRSLDPAMTSRFLVVPVRADRREWLGWARAHGVHPAIVRIVELHSEALDQAPPRSWTYASQALAVMTDQEKQNRALLHNVLAGYLPDAWAVLVAEALHKTRAGDLVATDLLQFAATDANLRARLGALRDQGRTDVLRQLATDTLEVLRTPMLLARMITNETFSLDAFEATIAVFPGDLREQCQDALGANPAAPRLLGHDYAEVLQRGQQGCGWDADLLQWQRDPQRSHRAQVFVHGLCAWLRKADLLQLRRSNGGRRVLGRLLADLRLELRDPLLHCCAELMLEPILDRRKQ